jgi:multidrug transporter EmrE-like cation transporter
MKPRFELLAHLCILATLLLTVYGQLVLKWQLGGAGHMPEGTVARALFLLRQFLNPWIFSCFAAAFAASLFWMAALTRLDLTYAYPYMSLAFVMVMVFGALFLGEPINTGRIVGTLLVIVGLVVIARS